MLQRSVKTCDGKNVFNFKKNVEKLETVTGKAFYAALWFVSGKGRTRSRSVNCTDWKILSIAHARRCIINRCRAACR